MVKNEDVGPVPTYDAAVRLAIHCTTHPELQPYPELYQPEIGTRVAQLMKFLFLYALLFTSTRRTGGSARHNSLLSQAIRHSADV